MHYILCDHDNSSGVAWIISTYVKYEKKKKKISVKYAESRKYVTAWGLEISILWVISNTALE